MKATSDIIGTDQSKAVKPGRTKRRIIRVIKITVLIYCSVGIALYYLQEKFLFHPEPLAKDYQWSFKVPFQEINLPYSKEENLNIIRFLPNDSIRKGAVIYFHGNMKNIEHYAKGVKIFTDNGYEVWMPDYPGYGKTTGELTEMKLYDQALQVYKLARGRYKADSIIIYGRSLGSGLATYVGSYESAKLLILETPYYSIPDLFSSYAPIFPAGRMSKFKIPSGDYLADCDMPVVIFHGTDDHTIPYKCAAKLKPALKKVDRFISIEGGKHNDIQSKPEYINMMQDLLR